MLHPTSNPLAPRSPQTRLTPTAADVSNESLVDSHSQVFASRKPAHPVLSNNLIPRDYLASLAGSRSPGGPQRRNLDDFPSYTTSPSFNSTHEVGRTGLTQTQQAEPLLTGKKSHNTTPGSDLRPSPDLRPANSGKPAPAEALSGPGPSQISESPKSYASSLTSAPQEATMPRTSSIDSAISNISNVSAPQKQPGEAKDPSPQEVRNLIATAGSAENLVQHLLRDKSHAAAQNAQLWKLVDKQRALLLGLNKDLERATKDRDRYRKKLKELQSNPPPVPALHMDGHSPQSEGGASMDSNEAVIGRDFRSGEDHQTPHKHASPPIHSSPIDTAMMPSPLHLQQPHKFQSLSTQLANPTLAVTESSPLSEKPPKSFQASRKAAPRPLNLSQAKEDLPVAQQFTSSEVIISDAEEELRDPVQRGRRKTREEDDRDREIAALKEQEARSRSMKEKLPNNVMAENHGQAPQPLSSAAIDQMQAKIQGQLSPTSITSAGSSAQLSIPLRSPGLPVSPRPIGQALLGASLPMSPRGVGGNFPLSPRAPKQALPNPTTPGTQAPAPHTLDAQKKSGPSLGPSLAPSLGPSPLAKMNSNSSSDQPQIHDSPLSPSEVPPVNRSLVSPTWPDLLLPPNALPSIQVKVASSRLRPSRNSVLGVKPQDDTSVFSLSIFERASASELWRLEKLPLSLPNLEQQLRSKCTELPKLPDRKLFSGHSPVIIDARRHAIDNYFEELLDTPMDEQAAALICKYLSSDVLDSNHRPPVQPTEEAHVKQAPTPQSSGIPTKSGYLTKKGKNFGGWKSRYFVLDSPELRYFEAPGGAHLGTIKLLNARIGRQTQSDPPGRPEADSENQYRHAFLILEPKRKDMNSHLRHVLCAESDEERDEWVETLLHYIDERPAEPKTQYGAGVQNSQGKESKSSHKVGSTHTHDDTESKPASSPLLGHGFSDTPSPSNASSHTPDPSIQETAPASKTMISAPINGSKISDAGLWGNRSAGPGGSKDRDRDRGMRNLFHFRKSSSEQLVPPQAQQHSAPPKRTDLQARRGGHVRPVFGMQLTEAVEYYSPTDVEVYLPAVVYRCIEYLRVKGAANEEGLFRLSGSNIVIRSLKDRFNTEGDVDLLAEEEDYDVHAVASLFKMYLRELPATILTRELHLEFLKVLELGDKAQKIKAFNGLVHTLPVCNFMLLRSLSQYLLEVVQNSDRNKMSVKNVGIVFSPTLNIPAPVFSMFLTEFEAIFDKPMDRESIRSTEIDRDGALTPEDIRSPRRQMFTDLPTPAYNQNSFANNATTTGPAHSHVPPYEHQRDPSGELGFAPLQPSYESRSYVSHPQEIPAPPRYPPPQPPYGTVDYSGSTLLMTPENAATVKAKRRESAMLFL